MTEKGQPVYLDYNGTTPIHPEVRKALAAAWLNDRDPRNAMISEGFGNPSSSHVYGIEARVILNEARRNVSDLLGCAPEEVVFTSGGTESNNMAVQGLIAKAVASGNAAPHVVSSAVEHPSVENVLRVSKQLFGARVTVLGVNADGFLDTRQLEESLTPATVLLTLLYANNETGTIQKAPEIYDIVQRFNAKNNAHVAVHWDCSQAVGKVPVKSAFADLITGAGHKIYAPKGIGFLFIRRGISLFKLTEGAGQERNIRPGTENVLFAKAIGIACKISAEELGRRMADHSHLIQHIYNVLKVVPHKVNGAAAPYLRNGTFESHFERARAAWAAGDATKTPDCLPNTLNISFPGIPSQSIIAALHDVACVSAGAACHSDRVEISAVLKAMGVTNEVGMGTLRISVGDGLLKEDVLRAAAFLRDVVKNYSSAPAAVSLSDGHAVQEAEKAHGAVEAAPQSVVAAAPAKEEKAQSAEVCVDPNSHAAQNLLNFTQGLGCACKLRPQLLDRILHGIDFGKDANLIIGTETNDDAAIYMCSGVPVVLTTDFFSPVVKEAFHYGQIAAANALSDIYAMNARPVTALAVCGFNSARMTEHTIRQIMEGAVSKCKEAGVVIAGGHTIESVEPFFGLVCAGTTGVENIKKNIIQRSPTEPKEEIFLILTKKLGVGMITTAAKKGILGSIQNGDTMYQEAITAMATLNTAVQQVDPVADSLNALTDVTGFGLIGHLAEMLGTEYSAEIFFKELPVIDGIKQLFDDFDTLVKPTENNLEYVLNRGFSVSLGSPYMKAVVTDPVTSGGLLLAVQGTKNAQRVAEKTKGALIGRAFRDVRQRHIDVLDQRLIFGAYQI